MTALLAEFADEAALLAAAAQLREAGIETETYTPREPEGASGGSVLPVVILLAGLLGAGGTFLLETWATVWSYPINTGGRPDFSWPAYVPMAFEIGVLCAVAAGVLGFLVANRLPALYDPIDELDSFRRATRDGFFLAVRSAADQARTVLDATPPLHVETFG